MNILITGGSKGIGRAIAEHFGTRGNLVFINYASDDIAAADCDASIESRGGCAHALKSDVGTETGALQLADMVSDLTNKLDRLSIALSAWLLGLSWSSNQTN
jgi:enoyl-[acyl-carrier protein] reductase III